MKIYKFNESINNHWTDDKLKKFMKNSEYLTKILEKYLKLKVDNSPCNVTHFYFDNRERFIIDYKIEDDDEDNDIEVEYDDVIDFINSKSKSKKWTINTLFNHCEEYKYLTKTIEYYLRWKIDDYGDDNGCYNINFFFDGNLISYSDDDFDDNEYQVEDYDEMIDFLNDPDFFINSKKYNL